MNQKSLALLGLAVLCAGSGAQTIVNSTPAIIGFVDISTTGTAITGVDDETEHTFTTTIGNALFPAGPVLLGCNGVVQSGLATGSIGFTNVAIPATGVPTGLVAGSTGSILPFWDDLDFTAPSSTNVYWQETGGVLYIMYKNINRFVGVAGQDITFEIQVFGNPAPGSPAIQIVYPDSIFGGTQASSDNGASATIGYVADLNPTNANVQWSFNTPSLSNGMVLSIIPPFLLTYSSPFGPGSIQVDITDGPPGGTYFLALTLVPGNFPTGWFYGVDMSFPERIFEAAGPPFVGPLNAGGDFTIGPIAGAPPLTVYSVALGFNAPTLAAVPAVNSGPVTYTIP